MTSETPLDMSKLEDLDTDKELIRAGLIAELDAVNFYEQCAATTKDEKLKSVFLDIAREEKAHIGEFQTLLLDRDEEQGEEIVDGGAEVEELTSNMEQK